MSALTTPPTGTVTFLFTDIEGSTHLWEQHPDAMRVAHTRHDTLLRSVVEQNHGYIVKATGDGVHAAFATAPDALAAVLTAQRALRAEPWGRQVPISVRMGMHTGMAERRDGDYYGGAVNRAVRLMAAGRGGQVLMSAATQELVRDHLPDGASLRDLGRHRLKDLGRPEQVFQLLHPSLPTKFPPLRSLDNPDLPNNLPQQTTSFIGREKQVEEVKALLGKTRLLTLTGAGGAGKTRLSLQVAADLLDGDGDGVWLVELAALSDPTLVPQAVANELGVKEQAGKSIQSTLVEALKAKRLLLVLDNCEHLVAACASLAAALLRSCPNVHILASSRQPLNVAGEQTYRVPSLSLPDPKQAQTVEALSQYEAVRLFIERAQAVQASFTITNGNAPSVAQVCLRLDGIPLALELAAARVRSLSVEEVNTRLDQRFRLLTGGSRTVLPRQQTLRALIDWSYDLLTEAEKTLLRRLSVFAGGWTLSAAEGVCSGDEVEDFEVLDLLTGLVDKSLVLAEEQEEGTTRYRLLETMRQYAGERLDASGEGAAVRGRHGAHFLALAERAETYLAGPEEPAWLGRIGADLDNLRAALDFCRGRCDAAPPVDTPDRVETGLRLVVALDRFWYVHAYGEEARRWAEHLLASYTPGGPSRLRARALLLATAYKDRNEDPARVVALLEEARATFQAVGDLRGVASATSALAWRATDLVLVRAGLEEALHLFRRADDQHSIADLLYSLARQHNLVGDAVGARALLAESLTLHRRSGNQHGVGLVLLERGTPAGPESGDVAVAEAHLHEARAIFHGLGDPVHEADAAAGLGQMRRAQGRPSEAQALYEEALDLAKTAGRPIREAYIACGLGAVCLDLGEAAALRWFRRALSVFVEFDRPIPLALCLSGLAGAATALGRAGRGARLLGAAARLLEERGADLGEHLAEYREDHARWTAATYAALGEATFAAAFAEGQAMTLEQAVEYALSATGGNLAER